MTDPTDPTDQTRHRGFWREFGAHTTPEHFDRAEPALAPAVAAQRLADVETFAERIAWPTLLLRYARAMDDAGRARELEHQLDGAARDVAEVVSRLSELQLGLLRAHFPAAGAFGLDLDAITETLCVFANGEIDGHYIDNRTQWLVWVGFVQAATSTGLAEWRALRRAIATGCLVEYARPRDAALPRDEIRALRERTAALSDDELERALDQLGSTITTDLPHFP